MSEKNVNISTPSGVLAVLVFFFLLESCTGNRMDCALGVPAACQKVNDGWKARVQEPTR